MWQQWLLSCCVCCVSVCFFCIKKSKGRHAIDEKRDQATAELHKSSAHVQIKCPRVTGGSWDWREFVTRPRPRVGWKLEYGHPRLTWSVSVKFHGSTTHLHSDQIQIRTQRLNWTVSKFLFEGRPSRSEINMLHWSLRACGDACVRQSCWRLVLPYLVTIHRLLPPKGIFMIPQMSTVCQGW